jgi:5-methylcytosine-specific restriction endonuclease McrA
MSQEYPAIIRSQSQIAYNYATIRITKSRLDKGLLAIPVSLIQWFPKQNCQINVFLDDSVHSQLKTYTSYTSRSRECRIGGLSEWFRENQIKEGDEIVLQVVDKDNFVYRLISEVKFITKTKQIQTEFDNSTDELNAEQNLFRIADWTRTDEKTAKLKEFFRLIKQPIIKERQLISKKGSFGKESTPSNIRILLGKIYLGHCQVCDFWFLRKDKKPYYEIHHLNPKIGNHIKNLILVCGNCHNQFEYADTKEEFKDGWLAKVYFNNRIFVINQIISKHKIEEGAKTIFVN